MSYRLEDGTGSRNKAAVFKNRVRVFAEEISLVNYQSVKSGNITQEQILNGEVIGVFTARNSGSHATTSSSNRKFVTLSISNNDPINLMVIDSIYFNVVTSSITLPIPSARLVVAIDNQIGTGAIPIVNDDIYSNIIPNVTAKGLTGFIDSSIRIVPAVFLITGQIIEFITPGSDAIILPGKSTNADQAIDINTISLSVFNQAGIGGVNTIFFDAFIRFSMIHPGDTG